LKSFTIPTGGGDIRALIGRVSGIVDMSTIPASFDFTMDWFGWLSFGIGTVLVGLGVYASAKDYLSSTKRRQFIRIAISLMVIGGVIIGYGIWRKVEMELRPRGEGNEGWQEMGQKEVSYYLTVLRDASERRGGVRT
jgi:hypothetical protein